MSNMMSLKSSIYTISSMNYRVNSISLIKNTIKRFSRVSSKPVQNRSPSEIIERICKKEIRRIDHGIRSDSEKAYLSRLHNAIHARGFDIKIEASAITLVKDTAIETITFTYYTWCNDVEDRHLSSDDDDEINPLRFFEIQIFNKSLVVNNVLTCRCMFEPEVFLIHAYVTNKNDIESEVYDGRDSSELTTNFKVSIYLFFDICKFYTFYYRERFLNTLNAKGLIRHW